VRIFTLTPPLERQSGAGDPLGRYFKGTDRESRITQVFGDVDTLDTASHRGQFDLVLTQAYGTEAETREAASKAFELMRPGGVIIWWGHGPGAAALPTLLRELASKRPLVRIQRTRLVVHIDGIDLHSIATDPLTDRDGARSRPYR
jgi:hypothetical protein